MAAQVPRVTSFAHLSRLVSLLMYTTRSLRTSSVLTLFCQQALFTKISAIFNDPISDGSPTSRCSIIRDELTRILTRKQCCRKEIADAAAALFGLKFANNIHYKFKSIAKLRKPCFRSSELQTYLIIPVHLSLIVISSTLSWSAMLLLILNKEKPLISMDFLLNICSSVIRLFVSF